MKPLTKRWKKLGYHPEQWRLWTDNVRFRVVPAARRSGKTVIAMRFIVRAALRETRFTDGTFVCAAPTWTQAKDIFWTPLKGLCPANMVRAVSESELSITLWNGCKLRVVSMDKPSRIEGIPNLAGIVLDEYANMKESVWPEHVRPMLSETGGWAWFIGVPEGRNHYYDLYDAALGVYADDPEWDVYTWTTEEVLPLYRGKKAAAREIASAKRDMDAVLYDQEYRGSFVSFQGAVYYEFDRAVHASVPVAERYNPEHDLYLCFDFNVNPGVAAIGQDMDRRSDDPPTWANRFTAIIGEVFIPGNSNTPAVCRKICDDWAPRHTGRVFIYGDETGGNRHSSQTMGTDWDLVDQELRRRFKTIPYTRVLTRNPPERVRVNAVNRWLKSADGVISMLVDPVAAPHVVRDFEGVRIKEGTNEIDKSTKDGNNELSHLSDGIGYMVHFEHPIADYSASAVPLVL